MLFIYIVCAISVVHGYDYQRFAQKNCKMEFLQLSEIVQFPVANPEVCVAKCSADSNCEVFVYQHSTRTCYWGSKLEEVVEPPSNNKADFDCYQMKQPGMVGVRRSLKRSTPFITTEPPKESTFRLKFDTSMSIMLVGFIMLGTLCLCVCALKCYTEMVSSIESTDATHIKTIIDLEGGGRRGLEALESRRLPEYYAWDTECPSPKHSPIETAPKETAPKETAPKQTAPEQNGV